MSKVSSNSLFQLIHSMSKGEKRFFKLFAQRSVPGNKNYLKLFDAMDGQSAHDDHKIREKLAGEKFLQRLDRTKYYLYQLVMKSLRTHHASGSINSQIKELLHDVEILYTKGLYNDCSQALKKVKKIADENEKYLLLMEIMDWEKKIALGKVDIRSLETDAGETFKGKMLLLEKQKKLMEYSHHHTLIYLLSRTGTRNADGMKKYRALMKSPLLTHENKKDGFQEQIYFYRIHINYYWAAGEFAKVYVVNKKWIALMESHPEQIIEEPNDYLSAVNNLIGACSALNKDTEVIRNIHKLRAISDRLPPLQNTETLRIRIFSRSYNMELAYYLNKGEFAKGVAVIDKAVEGLLNFENKMSKADVLLFYYKIVVLYYCSGNHPKALLWMNKILNESNKKILPDLYSSAQITNLLLHFDMQHLDLLEYVVKSANYYLDKRKLLYQFEIVMIRFIKKDIPAMVTNEQRIDAFKKLKLRLIELKKDPDGKIAFEYFDYISWVESKIENRPFGEVIKEKLKKAGRSIV